MRPPYDPLQILRTEFHATLVIKADGSLDLAFDGFVPADHQKKAHAVAKAYGRLLRLQLENGGASVRELVEQGKVRMDEG